ncbi:MAG: thioredoxin family protein, partial [Polyangiaceae bacterium]
MKIYMYVASILFLVGCAHDPGKQMLADDMERSQNEHHGWGCSKLPMQPGCSGRVESALPTFIEDDYPRALAEAKAKHVPIFVDASASWCHSCVSLKQFVFKDSTLAEETRQFVWLAIDIENPKNADFIAKFPSAVLPTLRVIDPANEVEILKWEGTLTAKELVDTLDHVRSSGGGNTDASRARDEDAEVMQLALRGQNDACAKRAAQLIGHLPNG